MARLEPKFVAAFAVIAGACAWGATSSVLLAWPMVTFAVVAASYAGAGPHAFGKNARGELHPVSIVVLAPYLVFAWLVLFALRFGGEAGHHEIRPRLFLGRRPLRASELPPGVTLIVDLTSEFPGVRPKDAEYMCLPTLDGSAPTDVDAAWAIIERIRAHEGIVYVHCAAGHGRSAAIVTGVLVAEGRADDVKHAVRLIRAVRPKIGLSRSQRALVAAIEARHRDLM